MGSDYIDEETCCEYICGCCLREEFVANDITGRCEKTHNATLRERYCENKMNKDFRECVLKASLSYEEVVYETNKKIEDHVRLVKPKINKSVLDALEHVKNLIDNQNVDNFADSHSLLKVHGQLIQMAQNTMPSQAFTVCENCSAFKKTEDCTHKFCKVYRKIRSLAKECKKTLNTAKL